MGDSPVHSEGEERMTPEAKARQQIDQKLKQAGWVIQDMKQLNLGAAIGVAAQGWTVHDRPGLRRAARCEQAAQDRSRGQQERL